MIATLEFFFCKNGERKSTGNWVDLELALKLMSVWNIFLSSRLLILETFL